MPVDQPSRPWLPPLSPVVVERRYVASAPFAAGGRRSVRLRSPVGGAVRSPCTGVVSFRGSVAGSPPTVTVACGALRATLRWVRSPVRRGQLVGRGGPLGVATGPSIGLSARHADGSYLDPLPLLGAAARRRVPPPMVSVRRRPGSQAARQPVPRAVRPVHLPAAAYALAAGSGSVAASGARPGRRSSAGAVAVFAPPPTARPVDWPLTVAGVGAVVAAVGGSAVMALRRRRPRTGQSVPGHLIGARR